MDSNTKSKYERLQGFGRLLEGSGALVLFSSNSVTGRDIKGKKKNPCE